MKPAMHQSDLEMLSKCPKMYELRRVDGLKVPPGIAVHAGTGVHVGAAEDYRNKQVTGHLLEAQDVTERAVAAFESAVHLEGAVEDSPEDVGRAKDRVVRLSGLHHSAVAPGRVPVGVEKSFRLELQGYPIDVVGTIDLEEPDCLISDVKTSGKTPAADIAHSSVQLSAYALAVNVLHARPLSEPVNVRLDYLVDTKTPKHVPLESTRNAVDANSFLRRVELANAMIETGVFPPTSPTNWICSSKWCGYYDNHCPFGRRGRSRHDNGPSD